MPVKEQNFSYSLKTAQERRKGLKKSVVPGLIHKAPESKKVTAPRCLMGAQLSSHICQKSHFLQHCSSSLEHYNEHFLSKAGCSHPGNGNLRKATEGRGKAPKEGAH